MKVLLLRHGQTEWNALQKYQGHMDIALNDTGREQAGKIARYLHDNENIEAIYCSDLSRSRETAEIIAHELHLPVQVDKRLREIGFGSWEGMTYEEVKCMYPEEYEKWFNNNLEIKVPGGESVDELLARSLPVLSELAERHEGTVLVVSHGGLIKTVLNYMRGNERWDIYLYPASISSLEWNGEQYVTQLIGFTLPDDE
ncbi:MAG TPA: alpha-ribazole phosphatase [Syntrophomonas sp.]|nr:alpha-ribazole phosphatase [Syntrophomonas sp.]HPT69145.1 alpha-ribazole phosphatase [Syntrophomonas sp.]